MSKRILVIEDTEDNRQIIRDLLDAAGCDDYIAKPFSPRALLQKIRARLG